MKKNDADDPLPPAGSAEMSAPADRKQSAKDYLLALVPVLVTGILLALALWNLFGEGYTEAKHERLAKQYFNNGEYEKAVIEYDAVIKYKPWFGDAYYQRGKAHLYLHHYDEAIADLSVAVKSFRSLYYIWNDRCFAYYKRGDYLKAYEDCRKALEISPEYAPAHYNLGLVYKALGQVGEAISAFKHAVEYSHDEALTADALHELELLNAK